MERTLLGYDIKYHPKYYVDSDWNKKRRSMFLLDANTKWPLSVDNNVWPSVFHYSFIESEFPNCQDMEKIMVKSKDTMNWALELWKEKDKMVEYYCHERECMQENIVIIAETLVTRFIPTIDSYWQMALDMPVKSLEDISGWEFLGYDIADQDGLSGLTNCGYEKEESELLRILWSTRLNEYGLIKNIGDAEEMLALSDKRISEHSPFYIYGIYSENPIK